jgi:hypothetical protein
MLRRARNQPCAVIGRLVGNPCIASLRRQRLGPWCWDPSIILTRPFIQANSLLCIQVQSDVPLEISPALHHIGPHNPSTPRPNLANLHSLTPKYLSHHKLCRPPWHHHQSSHHQSSHHPASLPPMKPTLPKPRPNASSDDYAKSP